ncbi:MAG: hypothetical protein O4860_12465 [Trichodesmium sp. St2_bin2_1]|nr:hypothetical protein [Trichodesmium sp. St2_bin2_1]
MINWREYTIYLKQIFDDISVFYTRVNYIFLPSKLWLFSGLNALAVAINYLGKNDRIIVVDQKKWYWRNVARGL